MSTTPAWPGSTPDFDSLEADDRFRALTEAVFLPLLDWVQTHVQAQPSASA